MDGYEYGSDTETVVGSSSSRMSVQVAGRNAVPEIDGFDDPKLDLDNRLLDNLRKLDHKDPTPIQSHGIPQISALRDVMCVSHTGSGKTCTYLVPIINDLLKKMDKRLLKRGHPQALVILPTRELAEQVHDYAVSLMKGFKLNSVVLFGGDSVAKELGALRSCSDGLIVATPGRLTHLINDYGHLFTLKSVRFLILDEADELFDRGFFPVINEIIKDQMAPQEERVNVMISATFPQQIRYYAKKHLRQEHVFIVVGTIGAAAPNIFQNVLPVSEIEKQTKLFRLYEDDSNPETKRIIIFLNSIEKVDLLASQMLTKKQKIAVLHSGLPQHQRDQAVHDLKTGRVRALVTTDVASRGLNVDGVTMVINYDMPKHGEDYIQRIGRVRPYPGDQLIPQAVSFFDLEQDKECITYLLLALESSGQDPPSFLVEADLKIKDNLREIEKDMGMLMNDDMRAKAKKFYINRAEVFEEEEFLG